QMTGLYSLSRMLQQLFLPINGEPFLIHYIIVMFLQDHKVPSATIEEKVAIILYLSSFRMKQLLLVFKGQTAFPSGMLLDCLPSGRGGWSFEGSLRSSCLQKR